MFPWLTCLIKGHDLDKEHGRKDSYQYEYKSQDVVIYRTYFFCNRCRKYQKIKKEKQ